MAILYIWPIVYRGIIPFYVNKRTTKTHAIYKLGNPGPAEVGQRDIHQNKHSMNLGKTWRNKRIKAMILPITGKTCTTFNAIYNEHWNHIFY